MSKFKRLENKMGQSINSTKKAQKDWIVSNFSNGNLLCLTIEFIEEQWYLTEYVNFYGLTKPNLQKMVDMGYMTMLDAAKKSPEYVYVIGKHDIEKSEIRDSEYWKGLIPKTYGKHSIKEKIDKDKFESEVNKLNYTKNHSK